MIIDLMNNLLGLPPVGFEWVQYVVGTVLLFYIIKVVFWFFSLFGMPNKLR